MKTGPLKVWVVRLVVIAVQHGPIHYIFVDLTLDLGRSSLFHLFPGAAHNILIEGNSFFFAESLHLFANGLDEVDHHGL